MPYRVGDRVLETSTTTGTGTITLAGAVTGYRAFSSVATNDGDWFIYVIDAGTGLWEVGKGVRASSTTFTRAAADVIAGSSGAGVLVNFLSGTKNVWMDIASSTHQAARLDPSRNIIINGGMDISQELPTGSVNGTGKQAADMFWTFFTMGGTVTTQKVNSTVAGLFNAYRMLISPGSAVGAAQRSYIYNSIEGPRWAKLNYGGASASPIVLSFWAFATASGTSSVSLQNGNTDRSYVKTFTINAGNTWEFKQLLIPGDITGTWFTANGTVGAFLEFNASTGANFLGTDAAWQAGDKTGVSGVTNFFATTNNVFAITGVSLFRGIEGPSSTEAANMIRNPDEELNLCQRYYEKSFDATQAPAAGLGEGGSEYVFPSTQSAGAQSQSPTFPFAVRKAFSPTMTLFNPGAAGGEVRNENRSENCSGTNYGVTETGFWVVTTGSASTAFGDRLGIDWVADARI
jgi:hypothetical protein